MMPSLFTGRTAFDLALWVGVFLLILVGMGWSIWLEKRKFQALGKQRSWMWLRLLSLPILALTGLVVLLPARAISGPMALGFFNLALITVGPLTWFGLHWIIGRILTPSLTRSESTGMALLGLGLLIGPAIMINMLQGPVFRASHLWNESTFARAEKSPLAHHVQPMQRFRLGDSGEIYSQTLEAPTEVRVERIEAQLGDTWQDTKTVTHSYLCRQGDNLHLAWPTGSPPPPLRLYWRNNDNTLLQAEFRVDSTAANHLPVRDFVVGWREDGFDLPIPISRDHLQFGWPGGADKLFYRSFSTLQPGETFENDCVMLGYHRLDWQKEGPIRGLLITFHPNPPAKFWQYEVQRPDELPQ